ncbi:MAG: MarR family transcriptional regulator [Candidatus Gracilibacteria bacterium]|nr:MarR family transcriptional regulator [Candidatus Gracilibacteria bacterium]
MTTDSSLEFFLNLAKVQAVMFRRFDSSLGGLGFNEFIILYHLSQIKDNKLRRIDLADKIGLTASGVTRMLLPMEKIGLVSRETNENDARVSYVILAPGGRLKLEETLERAQHLSGELIPTDKRDRLLDLSILINDIGGALMWKR